VKETADPNFDFQPGVPDIKHSTLKLRFTIFHIEIKVKVSHDRPGQALAATEG
jgi:hypothetical protein